MTVFLHKLETLVPGSWGEKGDALVRVAKAGLPVAPGFLLASGSKLNLPSSIKELDKHLGRSFGSLEEGYFLYVRLLPLEFKPGRLETAKYLGLHPENLPSDAAEILTRKAGISVWSQLSALSNQALPTLDDWLEEQGFDPLKVSPSKDQVHEYCKAIESEAGQILSADPLVQLSLMIETLQIAEPEMPILVATMLPIDISVSSLRARLVSRDPQTGATGVVGQRLRSRLIGDTNGRVTGEMVLPRLETLQSGFRTAVDLGSESLENTFQDIMEFDVSVDKTDWHILHLDSAQSSPDASLQLAVDLEHRGHIDQTEALSRLSAAELEGLLHSTLDPDVEKSLLCDGFAAAPGAVSGKVVFDAAEALFEVDDYDHYVKIQSEAALRGMATKYPYDIIEEKDLGGVSLSSHQEQVAVELKDSLKDRLQRAGIEVLEARISHLAYAPEIAQAMLRRQQASAVVAARREIVNGAVGMVELALEQLTEKDIITFDDDKKAMMVSNLLVVLCSEDNTSPIVNAGL